MYICTYVCMDECNFVYVSMYACMRTYVNLCICISYNTDKSALPDVYMHDARRHTAPKGECGYIMQSTSACVA